VILVAKLVRCSEGREEGCVHRKRISTAIARGRLLHDVFEHLLLGGLLFVFAVVQRKEVRIRTMKAFDFVA